MRKEIFPPQVDQIAFASQLFIGFLPSAYIWICFYWVLGIGQSFLARSTKSISFLVASLSANTLELLKINFNKGKESNIPKTGIFGEYY